MKRFLILNKEVYIVSYIVEAETEEEAIEKWKDEQGEEIDLEYLAELNMYTKYSTPHIQELSNI